MFCSLRLRLPGLRGRGVAGSRGRGVLHSLTGRLGGEGQGTRDRTHLRGLRFFENQCSYVLAEGQRGRGAEGKGMGIDAFKPSHFSSPSHFSNFIACLYNDSSRALSIVSVLFTFSINTNSYCCDKRDFHSFGYPFFTHFFVRLFVILHANRLVFLFSFSLALVSSQNNNLPIMLALLLLVICDCHFKCAQETTGIFFSSSLPA
jgi:hypothetical protein